MRREFRWDKKYLYWGLTAFFVIAGAIILYFILSSMPAIGDLLSKIWKLLSPFVYGLMIAYIMKPIMVKINEKLPKGLSVLICILIVLIVLAALVWLIIPELVSSITKIITNSPSYINTASGWIEKIIRDNQLEETINSAIGNLDETIVDLLQTKLVPQLESILTNVTSGVYYVVRGVYNLIIGIIVSVYVLGNFDKIATGFRKVMYSIFTVQAADRMRAALRFVDKTFMNFLTGKLVDSLIIGMLCYIFCAIVNMPYALLVSVIVGITNIIPFFGPFIGAIPSAIIILMVNPVKCLVFVIFIIILQQIDGNFIGPKILGSSIGINGFWVMFSIIIAGGLFGFWGMFLGVPAFVCIYTGIRTCVNRKLRRSDLPVESEKYKHLDYIDPDTNKLYYRKVEPNSREKKTEKAVSAK